jgi:hypothetical protein
MATNPNGIYNLPEEQRPKKARPFMYTAKDIESEEVTQAKKDICERIIIQQQINAGEMLSSSCAKYGVGVHVFLKWLDMKGMEALKEDFALSKHKISKLSPNNISSRALQAISEIIDNPEEIVTIQKESSTGIVTKEVRSKKNKELQVSAAKFIVERSLPTYSKALQSATINGVFEYMKVASKHGMVTPDVSMIMRKVLIEFLRQKGIAGDTLLELDDIVNITDIDLDDLVSTISPD